MPFPRRGRRRPFINSRWQIRRIETLCLFLAPAVRSTLTAWMKIYGETNTLPGLASGPIEVRFRRLREHTGADVFLLWTTSEHWSAGEGISLWIPAMGLAFECRFDEGRLFVEKARPTTEDERDPRRQRSAIGMELRPERIELPQDQEDAENPSAGLVAAFERLLDRRWTSFVDPLREALEAEARDDAARAERLATPYAVATPRIGGQSESDPYRLSGIDAAAAASFDDGEWLDLIDSRGRVISSARLVRSDPAEGTLDVDVRGADPPSEGTVRPRPQTQILAQKRAILDELDNPTGGLREAVRLVASPASLPPPPKRRPASFVNRLVAQNRSQVRAVSLALGLDEGQALMVQGPPGTGKSTTLAEILGQLVLRDPNVTVLVCSHSNHGVDNLLLKTLPYLETVPNLAIARVGLFDRVHPAARAHFVPPGEDLGAYNVVFTTVDALALQVEAGARTYDYAVLDEANRASILDSLIPLVRGRRFILVGDHLQLQPVLSEAEEQLRLEPAVGSNASAIGKSLFAWLRERRFPEAATVFLDEQNRMHPVIAGLISEVFYEGRLRSGRKAPRRVADVPLFPAAVTWVDTRGLHGLREARGRGASLVNVPEARLVATIARHMLATARPDVETGVISAYAEQTALLRRLLLQRGPRQNGAGQNGTDGAKGGARNGALTKEALRHLEIDTVDAFEGREKDIVIVSLVRSNRRRDIGFLRLMQRINVALSRARTMLIIVGDTSTLRGSYFDRIVRYVRANGMLVPGPRLIGRLLNARNGVRTDRVGERVAGPGRRRRPLPSPRTAFPERVDGPPGIAGPSGRPVAGEDGGDRRNRRRRRRVRGRPGAGPEGERRPVSPTINLGISPASEPEPDEPATQAEIDRFAALVEQLLGDGGVENAAPTGAEAETASESADEGWRTGGFSVDEGRPPERRPDELPAGPSRRRRPTRRRTPGGAVPESYSTSPVEGEGGAGESSPDVTGPAVPPVAASPRRGRRRLAARLPQPAVSLSDMLAPPARPPEPGPSVAEPIDAASDDRSSVAHEEATPPAELARPGPVRRTRRAAAGADGAALPAPEPTPLPAAPAVAGPAEVDRAEPSAPADAAAPDAPRALRRTRRTAAAGPVRDESGASAGAEPTSVPVEAAPPAEMSSPAAPRRRRSAAAGTTSEAGIREISIRDVPASLARVRTVRRTTAASGENGAAPASAPVAPEAPPKPRRTRRAATTAEATAPAEEPEPARPRRTRRVAVAPSSPEDGARS